MISTLHLGDTVIRSGALLLALLDSGLRGLAADFSPSLAKLSRERLRADLREVIAGSGEDARAKSPAAGAPTGGSRSTEALDLYTHDLTAQARAGRIDPIFGRDMEIRQIVDILTRRRQNNPILTGEAGVGKTAVVEGLALRIVSGDVPPPLRDVSLRTLDLGLLQAGVPAIPP